MSSINTRGAVMDKITTVGLDLARLWIAVRAPAASGIGRGAHRVDQPHAWAADRVRCGRTVVAAEAAMRIAALSGRGQNGSTGVSQWSPICSLARLGAPAAQHRRQDTAGSH